MENKSEQQLEFIKKLREARIKCRCIICGCYDNQSGQLINGNFYCFYHSDIEHARYKEAMKQLNHRGHRV